jgi:hypothetical protein
MTRDEKIKRHALMRLAHDLEVVLARYTNINQHMLDAIREALNDAYEAGRRVPNEMETVT